MTQIQNATSTAQARYEVGIPGCVLYFEKDIRHAFLSAEDVAKRNPLETVYVFDRMAHTGAVELWHYSRTEMALRVQRRKE